MLDVLNRYAHGFIVVPVTLTCRRRGIFAALMQRPHNAHELGAMLGANLGHLQVTLRLLESLGWIERGADGRFTANAAMDQQREIPDELWSLVDVDFDAYLRSGSGGPMGRWLEAVRVRWNASTPLMADFLDGMLVVPILALLTKRGVLRDLLQRDFIDLPLGVRTEVISLLKMLGWLEGEAGRFRLTAPGAFMFERAMNLGVAESYRPMLRSMERLLFGDAAGVFAHDADGHEGHVDRSMNVVSSGFQHDRYFAEVEEILISIFSREPFSAQPRYVADMGCGDGTFLGRVLATVRDKTPRGKLLEDYPLTLIGIDLNSASLEETSRTLAAVDHLVITGDIGNPRRLVQDLRAIGVDPEQVLHIRSFLDHDRPFIAPKNEAALAARSSARYLGAYADRNGNAIDAATVVQALVEHLERWAEAINRHGLILLEVHCQDPLVVRANIDQSESLYFDALEGFSQQLLVEADAVLMAAAEAGLFPRPEYFRKFPSFLPASRITLNLFERQDFRVRLATTADLPALLHLEEVCWPEGMRVPARELERRISTYALGQWLLELHGEVVGVIYSQRIADLERLRRCRMQELSRLHDDRGSIVQLLGLNVLPEVRHLGLGDRLLDLMLMRSSLQGGVRQVAGVTRCKDFRGRTLEELAAYVRQRDAAGHPIDPILQFHHSHGAELLELVADFRPEDSDNLGAGVLLRYDLKTPGIAAPITADSGQHAPTAAADTATRLESCLRGLLGPKKGAAFSWTRPLREMGLDSLDLLALRTLLQQSFEQPLSPTFFFSHPTLQDIRRFFDRAPDDSERIRFDAPEPATTAPNAPPTPERSAVALPATPSRTAIALVGMAGRFPGGSNLDDYWTLLAEGRSSVTEVPADRWDIEAYYSADPNERGKIVSRHGGFLQRVDEFDAAFFNIAPREARSMDPQQRVLLEIHWEALENAGIDPARLRESSCGIFVGLYAHDYELLQVEAGGTDDLDVYYATGNSAAIAAGRVAYFLGTRGPALTLDTACSSSLVAVHQAIRSLRSGECDLAIASGVNLMLSPRLSIAFSQAGMLSPHGRCKTFDAGADGYVRAEGCGAVVLKRLDDAQRAGDNILAILRGSAINQDGASNGLTAPSLPAQEQLLRSALADANLQPADIDCVEAHGTGTSLGDPVEFRALQSVFGADVNRSEPLWIGSVKTNIGHAEAAAGIAGLIKIVLAMQRGWLPAHLHFERPNPHLDLEALPARIPVQGQPWSSRGVPLRAGVSAFGFSGTNAHVILEQAPRAQPGPSALPKRSRCLLALSARSRPALQALATRYSEWLSQHPDAEPVDICRAANAGRAHHDHRIACTGSTAADLGRSLHAAISSIADINRIEGAPKIAFLFTGQGSQYPGMAHALSLTEPVFRDALRECGDLLRRDLPQPLEQLLYPGSGQPSLLNDTAITQPALFAIEYALARTLQSWGVEPAAVMGHSVGEYAAACVAGVFSLEAGLKLIAARGRLMSALPQGGAMLAVLGPEEVVMRALSGTPALAIAAYNGPENIVVSGRRDAVDRLAQRLDAAGVKAVPLQVSHAFHSSLMEPMLPAFREIAQSVRFSPPRIGFVSNVTGALAREETTTADYWCRHIRQPVRFEEGIRALNRSGIEIMLEIGPHPVLTAMGQACALDTAASAPPLWLRTLSRGEPDRDGLISSLGALYERGVDVDWSRFDAVPPSHAVSLPTYPWQRKRYWFRSTQAAGDTRTHSGTLVDAPDSWFHNIAWIECSREGHAPPQAARHLPDPVELCEMARPAIATLGSAILPPKDRVALSELEDLAGRYAAFALAQLGIEFSIGLRFETASLRQTLGVQVRHARLFSRLLEILAEDGVLRPVEAGWEIAAAPRFDLTADPATATEREVLTGSPEAALLMRCGGQLARVLLGEMDPLQLLFPVDGALGAESVYRDADAARFYNRTVAALIGTAAESIPRGSVLRVLELGAGTGATTACVLEELTGNRRHYTFTDLGRSFVTEAEHKFAANPGVRCAVLDLEKPLAEQGFQDGCAEIVLAANVLHATSDLYSTLQRIRQLLAPGGLLVLLETTARRRWLDLTFGLTDGWWRFRDADLRPRHALLDADQWIRLLSETGFDAPVPVADEWSKGRLHQQAVLLARAGVSLPVQSADSIAPAGSAAGRWLIFADAAGLSQRIAARLERLGGTCILARAGDGFDATEPHRTLLRLNHAADYQALLSRTESWRGVVHAWSLDAQIDEARIGEQLDQAEALSCRSALFLSQAILRLPDSSAKLWLVTRGAQPAAWPRLDLSAIGQAPLWGFGRTFAIEHPGQWGGMIDVDPDADLDVLAGRICDELCCSDGEDQLALSEDARLAPRLLAARPPGSQQQPIRPDASYLITGAFGGLGPNIARWLVERGARHLYLCGRRTLPARALWSDLDRAHEAYDRVTTILDLERGGANVHVENVDVADRMQMIAMFQRVGRYGAPLAGIIHAAASIEFCSVDMMSADALHAALRAKVAGSWLLHELSRELPLDFFVLFSSATTLLGARRLAHYAAANQFLGFLAHYRRGLGLPAVSIDWGAWQEIRLLGEQRDEVTRFGLNIMAPRRALSAMARLGSSGIAQCMVADVNWEILKAAFETRGRHRLFEQIDLKSGSTAADAFAAPASSPTVLANWNERLLQTAPDDRSGLLSDLIATEARAVLALDVGESLDPDRGLFETGMDSMMSVQLRNRLMQMTGATLPATLTFTYPTVSALAGYLLREAFHLDTPSRLPAPKPSDRAMAAPALDDFATDTLEALDEQQVKELLSEELDSLAAHLRD
jgi:acyl transferase domain-containing protein/SAM-dependent methyltransferase/NAD(P)-dependent dehydrogenase (short-subunit alcohol dehydrogenase family)/acyl carrier protein